MKPRTIQISPMQPPTYAEALHYILRTPRTGPQTLDFFDPKERPKALQALAELCALGAVLYDQAQELYRLPPRRAYS